MNHGSHEATLADTNEYIKLMIATHRNPYAAKKASLPELN